MFERAPHKRADTAAADDHRRAAPDHSGAKEDSSVWRSLALRPGPFQRKLNVSRPDDPYEQEANRIADQVTSVSTSSLQRACDCGGACGQCGSGQSEDEGLRVQPLRANPAGSIQTDAPPAVGEALRSSGRPLGDGTRSFMESQFGYDFGSVRVHTDAKAAASARSVNALAYTVGSDIILGAGAPAQETSAGQKLLAHELTHVVQQSGGSGPQQLQRWSLSNCDKTQSVHVEKAFAQSSEDLSKAVSILAPPTTTFVKNALYLAFRDDSEATANKLRKDIGKLKQNITTTNVTCQPSTHPDCGTDFGYHQAGKIYLCMPTFLGPDHGPIQQANTLTHEAVHKYLDVRDTGYFTKNCDETPTHGTVEDKDSGTAGDNPIHRFNNADAYSCFVHFLVRRSVASVEESAWAYRGTLELEAKEKRIYTITGTPSRDDGAIRMKGAPPNSGFRYRWRLFSAGKELPLAAMNNSRANPSVFNDDVTVVYVPTEARERLAEMKATKANMVIEIQVFKPDEKSPYAPPFKVFLLDLEVAQGQDPFDTSKI